MKRVLRSLALLLFAVPLAGVVQAQEVRHWLIIEGPGAGTLLESDEFGTVTDFLYEHFGSIGSGEGACNDGASHYHGVLYATDDPAQNGCGWGVVQEVSSSEELVDAVEEVIEWVAMDALVLAAKLAEIISVVESSIESDCYSLFKNGLEAFNEEMSAARKEGFLSDEHLGEFNEILTELGLVGAAELAPPPPPAATGKCKVKLKLRLGSGDWVTTVDPRSEVTFPLGAIVLLDAEASPPGGEFKWVVDFGKPDGFKRTIPQPSSGKGPRGDVPNYAGFGAQGPRAQLIAQRGIKASITVTYFCPDGKTRANDSTNVVVR